MKKRSIKMLAVISCIALCTAAFIGCGTQTPAATVAQSSAPAPSASQEIAATTAPTPLAEKVTLSLLTDNQSPSEGLVAVCDAIEKKYNIATELDIAPGGGEGGDVIKTRLATGDMDDLCAYNSGSLFQALDPVNNFMDLTDEPFMANIMDTFKVCVSVNGRVYGIPSGPTSSGGWLYNKKVYAELGLSVPKTWDELMANCEKIKAAGRTAIIGSYKDSWTAQLILLADYYNVQAQVPNFAEDYTANKAKYATIPAALEGFQKLQDVYTKGYLNKDFLATTYDAALKMLAEGTGAHYPMLTFALPTIAENYPDQVNDIGFFAQPGNSADSNGLTVWVPGGIYLYKNSKYPDALLTWASFYASVEGVDVFMTKEKPEGPFVIKGTSLPDDVLPAVKDLLPYFDSGNTAPALEFLSPIKGPNLPQICVEAGSGIKSPLECAQEYDNDVEKQAKQLGLPGWK
jgi:raffinose/stachyose/melibiose transport system substrate-binding protein